MSRKTVLLIDLSGLWRMNWHATQDLELGEAYSRTIASVNRLSNGYDHVAVCLDAPPYRRKAVFAEYKAQRDKPSEQMVEQFRRVKERLTLDGFLLWSAQGYEADDIIATAVEANALAQCNTMIASSDKDLLQLVIESSGPDACGWVHTMSLATGEVFDEKAVVTKFGVGPRMMGDLLALMGDKSDNIAGIDGVGPKTAAELLHKFGSFENVLTCAHEIKTPKLRENVKRCAAAARLAAKLVKLETNAPINVAEIFERREAKPLASADTFDGEFEEMPEDPAALIAPPTEPAPPTKSDPPPRTEATRVQTIQPTPDEKPSNCAIVLAAKPQEWAMQLEPDSTESAIRMAKHLHDSRLFQNYGTAQAIFAIILRGRSLGIDAVTALSNFHVIEGKPTMHASLIVGLILRSGKADYFELVKSTDEIATWATRRKGSQREIEMSFSVRDALNAGLLEGTPENAIGVSKSGKPSNWDKYRRTMLRWRAAVELCRAVYPDVTTGLYTPDEVADGVFDPKIEESAA
jgi:5'-3' exonuclease